MSTNPTSTRPSTFRLGRYQFSRDLFLRNWAIMFVFAVVALRSSTGVTLRPAVRLRSRYRHGHGRLRRRRRSAPRGPPVFAVLFAFWGLSYDGEAPVRTRDRGPSPDAHRSPASRPRRCGVRESEWISLLPAGPAGSRWSSPRPRLGGDRLVTTHHRPPSTDPEGGQHDACYHVASARRLLAIAYALMGWWRACAQGYTDSVPGGRLSTCAPVEQRYLQGLPEGPDAAQKTADYVGGQKAVNPLSQSAVEVVARLLTPWPRATSAATSACRATRRPVGSPPQAEATKFLGALRCCSPRQDGVSLGATHTPNSLGTPVRTEVSGRVRPERRRHPARQARLRFVPGASRERLMKRQQLITAAARLPLPGFVGRRSS